LSGVVSIPDRIVSLHDPEARPIRKGKLKKPNEFGRTLQLVQDSSGVILDHELHDGNPSDKKNWFLWLRDSKNSFAEHLQRLPPIRVTIHMMASCLYDLLK